MFFRKKKPEEGKKAESGSLDKLITGVIIGGAIGSVIGATLSDKEKRDKFKEAGKEQAKSLWDKAKNLFGGKE